MVMSTYFSGGRVLGHMTSLNIYIYNREN